MNVIETDLPGVLILEPARLTDDRGWFHETWTLPALADAGISAPFVQENAAWSHPRVLRGLHWQWPDPQAKLISVPHGAVLDVAVDLRRDAPTFGRAVAVELSAESSRLLWIPEGFAHGYAVLGTGPALVTYRCTAPYVRGHDRAVRWDDPQIGVRWPHPDPILSPRDRSAPLLRNVDPGALPALS